MSLNILLVTRAGIHKMITRIANREGPDQTALSEVWSWSASSEVWSGSALFV